MNNANVVRNHEPLPVQFRPHFLSGVKGQPTATEMVKKIMEKRDLTPIMFSGPAGTGKTTLARQLGEYFNCSSPSEDGPCGKCNSCKSIRNGNSLNVIELDGASNNKREDIEALLTGVNYVPMGDVKVLIIDECQQLTKGSWDMLLKVVEEPPQRVLFVFCTTDPDKVPPAIKTRCHAIRLTRISDSVIKDRLIEICTALGHDYEDDALSLIVQTSSGSMRDAITWLGMLMDVDDLSTEKAASVLGVPDETQVFNLLNAVASGSLSDALDAITGLDREGKPAANVVRECQKILRDTLIVLENGDVNRLTATEDYRNGITSLASVFDATSAKRVFRNISKVIPQTILDLQEIVIRCLHEEDDIAILYQRINSLEKELKELKRSVAEMPKVYADQSASASNPVPNAPVHSEDQKPEAVAVATAVSELPVPEAPVKHVLSAEELPDLQAFEGFDDGFENAEDNIGALFQNSNDSNAAIPVTTQADVPQNPKLASVDELMQILGPDAKRGEDITISDSDCNEETESLTPADNIVSAEPTEILSSETEEQEMASVPESSPAEESVSTVDSMDDFLDFL